MGDQQYGIRPTSVPRPSAQLKLPFQHPQHAFSAPPQTIFSKLSFDSPECDLQGSANSHPRRSKTSDIVSLRQGSELNHRKLLNFA